MRRELMEELQVKVTNLRDFYTVEYDYPIFISPWSAITARWPMNPASRKNTTANSISVGFRAPHLPPLSGCPPTRGSLMP